MSNKNPRANFLKFPLFDDKLNVELFFEILRDNVAFSRGCFDSRIKIHAAWPWGTLDVIWYEQYCNNRYKVNSRNINNSPAAACASHPHRWGRLVWFYHRGDVFHNSSLILQGSRTDRFQLYTDGLPFGCGNVLFFCQLFKQTFVH